jgi:phosphoribosylformylglycinamidine cyclo-ligase
VGPEKSLKEVMAHDSEIRYRDAGVNIDEADRAVAQIKEHARKTMNRHVLAGIGSFGAGYELTGYKKPVLVSSADGVGTKLKVAVLAGKHDTIGEDLVNHCVNDIMVQGAKPLFFLDYLAMGKLDAGITSQIVDGVARGCARNRCALIGGETAEMPGMYAEGEYDLAGFIVGAVEKKELLTGAKIRPGDVLIGLASNGLHTNGYSLARKLLFETASYGIHDELPELGSTIAQELLRVHRSYQLPLTALNDAGVLKGAAHITGGGITENTPRMLPAALGARILPHTWRVPAIFSLLQRIGNVPEDDLRRTFNLGIGMIIAVSQKKAAKAVRILEDLSEPFSRIGEVIELPAGAAHRVVYE